MLLLMIPVQSLPSQPSPNCYGEYTKAATETTNCETNTKKTLRRPQVKQTERLRSTSYRQETTKFEHPLSGKGCSRFASTCGRGLCQSCSIFRAPQRFCPRQPWALQVDCPEAQNYLGSCLDLLNPSLCPLHLSKTKAPCTSCFLQISYI